MVLCMTEVVKVANDNSDPFSAIGLQAALIVNKLRLQAQLADKTERDVPREQEGRADTTETADRKNHDDAVTVGVRQIERFERIARGDDAPRRKRNF
jgi:hypothetical protein